MKLHPGAAFALCVAIWGGSWIAIRAAVEGSDPIGVAALRTSAAFVLLLAIALAMRLPLPAPGGASRAMAVGVVLIGVNFALVYWGSPRIPGGAAALLYATTPLQAVLLAPLMGVRDRFVARGLIGVALGVVGVGVAFLDARSLGVLPAVGVVAVLLGATTSAAGTVMARKWSVVHPVWLNVFANLSASFVLWAHHLAFGQGPPFPQTGAGWAGFAYMLVGGSVVGFLAYFAVVRAWDATRASITTLATPFVALVLGLAISGEPILATQLFGGLLLVAGGYLALWETRASPMAVAASASSAMRKRLSEK